MGWSVGVVLSCSICGHLLCSKRKWVQVILVRYHSTLWPSHGMIGWLNTGKVSALCSIPLLSLISSKHTKHVPWLPEWEWITTSYSTAEGKGSYPSDLIPNPGWLGSGHLWCSGWLACDSKGICLSATGAHMRLPCSWTQLHQRCLPTNILE